MEKKVIVLVLLAGLLSCRESVKEDQAISTISGWIEDFMAAQKIPGLSVALARGATPYWSRGFGYADLEQKVEVDPERTKFRIGSISKTLTATALARLYEMGQIDLDTNARLYVPEFPEKEFAFSSRQLAGHLAGIRHYNGDEFLIRDRYDTEFEGLRIFMDDPLLHQPGSGYRYSSHAWNLLSVVIERASGQEYLDLMQNLVFDPIGMNNTTADFIDSLIDLRTRYYVVNVDGRVLNAPYVDNSYKWAGGGFLSTSEDILTFALAHQNGGFLKDETLNEFIASQRTNDGKTTGYGMGWSTQKDDNGRSWYGHTGGSIGGTSVMRIYPEEDIIVVLLSNLSSVDYGDLPSRIADQLSH